MPYGTGTVIDESYGIFNNRSGASTGTVLQIFKGKYSCVVSAYGWTRQDLLRKYLPCRYRYLWPIMINVVDPEWIVPDPASFQTALNLTPKLWPPWIRNGLNWIVLWSPDFVEPDQNPYLKKLFLFWRAQLVPDPQGWAMSMVFTFDIVQVRVWSSRGAGRALPHILRQANRRGDPPCLPGQVHDQ